VLQTVGTVSETWVRKLQIKTQGDNPWKHRATTKSNQQEENTHPPENHRKENNCTGL